MSDFLRVAKAVMTEAGFWAILGIIAYIIVLVSDSIYSGQGVSWNWEVVGLTMGIAAFGGMIFGLLRLLDEFY